MFSKLTEHISVDFSVVSRDPLSGTEKPDKSKIPQRQQGSPQRNGVKVGCLEREAPFSSRFEPFWEGKGRENRDAGDAPRIGQRGEGRDRTLGTARQFVAPADGRRPMIS